MAIFYRDRRLPEVERLARAICAERGIDPDRLEPESGYPDAEAIPVWWKYQDAAQDFIAMMKAWQPDPSLAGKG